MEQSSIPWIGWEQFTSSTNYTIKWLKYSGSTSAVKYKKTVVNTLSTKFNVDPFGFTQVVGAVSFCFLSLSNDFNNLVDSILIMYFLTLILAPLHFY